MLRNKNNNKSEKKKKKPNPIGYSVETEDPKYCLNKHSITNIETKTLG